MRISTLPKCWSAAASSPPSEVRLPTSEQRRRVWRPRDSISAAVSSTCSWRRGGGDDIRSSVCEAKAQDTPDPGGASDHDGGLAFKAEDICRHYFSAPVVSRPASHAANSTFFSPGASRYRTIRANRYALAAMPKRIA